MIGRITDEIQRLKPNIQIDILRKLAEGRLTKSMLIMCAGKIAEQQHYFGQITEINELLSEFNTPPNTRSKPEERAIFDKYTALPIGERVQQYQTYLTDIIRTGGRNSTLLDDLNKISESDQSLFFAVLLCTSMLIRTATKINNLDTDELKICCHALINNPSKPIETENNELQAIIKQIQQFQEVLAHSYITPDKKDYIKFLFKKLIELELERRIPYLKTIDFLYETKRKISSGGVKLTQASFLMFGSKNLPCQAELKELLDSLPPEINVLAETTESDIQRCKDVFARITVIADQERRGGLSKDKTTTAFFQTMYDKIRTIIDSEHQEVAQSFQKTM